MRQHVKNTQRATLCLSNWPSLSRLEKAKYRLAQKRYGIQGCSTVINWLRKYGQLD